MLLLTKCRIPTLQANHFVSLNHWTFYSELIKGTHNPHKHTHTLREKQINDKCTVIAFQWNSVFGFGFGLVTTHSQDKHVELPTIDT